MQISCLYLPIRHTCLSFLIFTAGFLSIKAQNNALNFDGNDDIVTIPYEMSLTLSANPFTIEYWARPTQVGSTDRWIISKGESNGDLDYLVGLGANQKFTFAARNLGINFFAPTTTAIVGNWYHVANVFDGTSAKIYINGVLEATTSVVGTFVSNTSDVVIGARRESGVATQYFQGDVDEIRIWNTARTAAEIQYFYNKILSGNEPNLVAYYPFNQGVAGGSNLDVTTLLGITSIPNNGTLTGFALTGANSNWVSGVNSLVGNNALAFNGLNPSIVSLPGSFLSNIDRHTPFTFQSFIYTPIGCCN